MRASRSAREVKRRKNRIQEKHFAGNVKAGDNQNTKNTLAKLRTIDAKGGTHEKK